MEKKMEKSYHTNGQLYEICNYVDGKKEGLYKKYSKDGLLIRHKLYDNGVIIKIIL